MSGKIFSKFESGPSKIFAAIVFTANIFLFNAAASGLTNTKGGTYQPHVSGVGPSAPLGAGINSNKLALPGVVVVKFKPGVVANIQELFKVPELEGRILKEAAPTSMEPVLQAAHVRLDKASEILTNIYIVHYSGTVTPALMAQSLIKNPDVEYAEPHYIYRVSGVNFTPNDSMLSEQYALSKINAFAAWNITRGSSSVPIGIVDTGVDWVHPDLYGNIWHNPHWQTDTKYPNDSIGWDFGGHDNAGTENNDPEEDAPFHGTHVAGIAAAVSNNGIGIAGVAQCRIMAVKTSQAGQVDQNGEPYILWGFEGIAYAADDSARVINCSWGGVGYSQYEQDMINYATQEGALVVAAAGNDHSQEFQTPAYYDNVLSVAATDTSDIAASFTNFSYNVSVSAPGVDIVSTWGTNSYAYLTGTSMASPCAAGVAALVASQHPEYTPRQIMEQVRVSADNINSINPNYADMLGFGRVNAYRALTVASPGVRIDSLTLTDSATGSDNGGAFAPGETVQILGNVTDWLTPTSNLQLTLTSTDPYVAIINGSVSIGALQTKASYDLQKNALTFKVSNSTPYEHQAAFMIKITDGSYSDYKGFSVLLNPRFSQLALNNLETTITAKGNIGYNDYPNNLEGVGFIYQPDEAEVLFEGAFMAGTSSSNVVDEARDSTSQAAEEDGDFKSIGLVQVTNSSDGTEQESVSAFSDSNAATNRLGIQVTPHTYAYKSDSTGNFIILEYRIHNLNSSPLSNFYGGIFLDWDISPYTDIATYDGNYELGYAYDSTQVVQTYTGCALIYGANINYSAINNADPNTGIYSGFTKLHKWNALSGGTINNYAGASDISMVVSGGPLTIPGSSDTVLTFALVAGNSLQDLRRAVNVAREYYGVPTNVAAPPTLPEFTKLNQNYPNPFNPATKITFDLRDDARVTIQVFNAIGQKVATLTDQNYQAGNSQSRPPLTFSAAKLSSGVYFVRLTAVSKTKTYVQTMKMMVVK